MWASSSVSPVAQVARVVDGDGKDFNVESSWENELPTIKRWPESQLQTVHFHDIIQTGTREN